MVNYGRIGLAFVKATFQAPSFVILIHHEVLNPSHSNYQTLRNGIYSILPVGREFPVISEMTIIFVTVNDIYWRSFTPTMFSDRSH